MLMKSVCGATVALLFTAMSLLVAPPAGAQAAAGDARIRLATVQNALVRDDRPAFEETLITLRNGADAPSSTIVQEMLPHYELALRLWDVQFTSAFFAEDSEVGVRVTQYAGFAEAMRGGVVTDASGRRFYAAKEARDFVARVAGDRLRRAGIASVAAVDARRSNATTTATRSSSRAQSPASGSRSRRIRRAKD